MRRTTVVAVRAGAWALACTVLLLGLLQARPAAADDGPWAWPLDGPHAVSRPFAPPEHAYGAGHRGADLPAAVGAAVRSAGAGRVSYAGLLAGRGVVAVVHGGLRTTYEPVTASVHVGDVVSAGEAVGALDAGHLGCPAAACLHWGLRRGDEYLDPVRLVERGQVRLLPVRAAAGPALRAGIGMGGGGAPVTGPVDAALPGGVRATAGPATADRDRDVDAPQDRARAVPRAPSEDVADSAEERGSWQLRASDVPMGALAVAALVAGIGLLARPRPDPGSPPVAGAGRSVTPDVVESDGLPGPVAPVLELDVERLRRRTG